MVYLQHAVSVAFFNFILISVFVHLVCLAYATSKQANKRTNKPLLNELDLIPFTICSTCSTVLPENWKTDTKLTIWKFLKRKVFENWYFKSILTRKQRFLAFNLHTIVILCKYEHGKHVRFVLFNFWAIFSRSSHYFNYFTEEIGISLP